MNRNGKPMRALVMVLAIGLLMLGIAPISSAGAEGAAPAQWKIKHDGETVKVSPLEKYGRLYVPAARIAQLYDAAASWDGSEEEVTIHTAVNDTIVFGNEVPVVYFNDGRYISDAAPFMSDGKMYVPLRHLVELLHGQVKLDLEAGVVELETVKRAVLSEDYGLNEISEQTGHSKTELLKRNGLTAKSTLKEGARLKTVIPSLLSHEAPSYSEEDVKLLAKITMVEAGYEPFEGQLAIANIILNRVKDTRFPSTIRDVIYSGKQFPPAHNGLLDKSKPNASVKRAVKQALDGKNNIDDAVYFFNPKVSTGPFWSSLDVVTTIGHHSFAK